MRSLSGGSYSEIHHESNDLGNLSVIIPRSICLSWNKDLLGDSAVACTHQAGFEFGRHIHKTAGLVAQLGQKIKIRRKNQLVTPDTATV